MTAAGKGAALICDVERNFAAVSHITTPPPRTHLLPMHQLLSQLPHTCSMEGVCAGAALTGSSHAEQVRGTALSLLVHCGWVRVARTSLTPSKRPRWTCGGDESDRQLWWGCESDRRHGGCGMSDRRRGGGESGW